MGTTAPSWPTPMPPPMDAPDLRQLSRSHGATESACGQHDRVARHIAIIHHATDCRPNLAPGCHLCAPNATHSWSKHQLTHPESSTQQAQPVQIRSGQTAGSFSLRFRPALASRVGRSLSTGARVGRSHGLLRKRRGRRSRRSPSGPNPSLVGLRGESALGHRPV